MYTVVGSKNLFRIKIGRKVSKFGYYILNPVSNKLKKKFQRNPSSDPYFPPTSPSLDLCLTYALDISHRGRLGFQIRGHHTKGTGSCIHSSGSKSPLLTTQLLQRHKKCQYKGGCGQILSPSTSFLRECSSLAQLDRWGM